MWRINRPIRLIKIYNYLTFGFVIGLLFTAYALAQGIYHACALLTIYTVLYVINYKITSRIK